MKTKDYVKFKLRCSRFLYTHVMRDTEKAEKLKTSLPPGLWSGRVPGCLGDAQWEPRTLAAAERGCATLPTGLTVKEL